MPDILMLKNIIGYFMPVCQVRFGRFLAWLRINAEDLRPLVTSGFLSAISGIGVQVG